MAKSPEQTTTKEKVGKGLETGGIVGMIIGFAAINLEIVLFSAASWYGGKKIKGEKKQ
jgi:hypothetical protein